MSRALVTALRENMRRAVAEGRHEEAEQILSRLREEDPLSQETRGFELEMCLNSNRLAEAEALARQLCALFPESARIAFLAGKLAYRLKQYNVAEAHFSESRRLYPHWRTQYWLGKTLTQTGRLDEAEPLLLQVRDRFPTAHLELAWLYERRNDLQAAMKECDAFLALQPDHAFANERRMRIKARMLEPESFIEEIGTLAELGEEVPPALFPDYVQNLFDMGQTVKARDEVSRAAGRLDPKTASRTAWVCYKAQAYDLACTLFLAHLRANLSYFKYLNALEAAAARCGRTADVVEAYRSCAAEMPRLHGRLRSLARRSK